MAVVLPFRLPAHAPPEPDFSRVKNWPPEGMRLHQGPPVHQEAPAAGPMQMHQLPLSAADREALLAALEAGIALCAGDATSARRMAQAAYNPVDLGAQLERLADRLFALGRQAPVNVWQVP